MSEISNPAPLRGRAAARPMLLTAALLLAGACAVLQASGAFQSLDWRIYDAQTRYLREHYPRPLPDDVVLVGIDEKTVTSFPAPMALWHEQLAALLQAMVIGEARVLALDMILPDRSYDFILPGNDRVLMQAMLAARGQVPVVFGRTFEGGRLRDIFPPFIALLGKQSFGLVIQPRDRDGVVRVFGHDNAQAVGMLPLAGQAAAHMGVDSRSGWINYTIGADLSYVPLQQVVQWVQQEDDQALRETFAGRPVLLGGVLPFVDRHLQPASIAAWEDDPYAPGVMTHVQALRSLISGQLLQPASPWLWWLSFLLPLPFVLLGGRSWLAPVLLLGWGALLLMASTIALYTDQRLTISAPWCAALLIWLVAFGYHSALLMRERGRLRNAFGGYVSPQIMREILQGNLTSEIGGQRQRICVLFADVRGFTTLTETLGAEQIIDLLNGYFEHVTPVIHDHGGTLDKYIGDGIMAFFGAPNPLPNPSQAAFAAAQGMLEALHSYNQGLHEQSRPTLSIGIGLEVGDVVVGHIGSSARYEYTAIGDAVNVAARVEGLTRQTGYAIMMSTQVAAELGDLELASLGSLPIKGHTPVELLGWGRLPKSNE